MRSVLLALMLTALVGCGDSGTSRLRLSGAAAYDGNPIVHGDVVLTPDGAKGNSGTQGIANIRDGRYDTAQPGGKGYAGGPTILRVTGFSGPGGKLLCEFEYPADLPREDNATHDIAVPKKAAVDRKPGKEI